MLKSVGTNLALVLIAWSLASQGAQAAPLPKFSIPKFGGGAKADPGPPPRTTNNAGEPISFFDTDSVLDQPIKSSGSGIAAKVGKGAAIGGFVAGVAGGGAAAGYRASQTAGQPGFGSL